MAKKRIRAEDGIPRGLPIGRGHSPLRYILRGRTHGVHEVNFNGHESRIIMSGTLAPKAPRPVIGAHKARITYPLDAPAHVSGEYGRAWLCDLNAARAKMLISGMAQPDTMMSHWIVEAPWSHEVVHSYSLILIHLRHSPSQRPVFRYRADATHELTLYPIHPAAPREQMLAGPVNPTMWVPPIAFASQIAESTDPAAEVRIYQAVKAICAGKLSPHPDHARYWAELFGDCMLSRALPPEPEKDPT